MLNSESGSRQQVGFFKKNPNERSVSCFKFAGLHSKFNDVIYNQFLSTGIKLLKKIYHNVSFILRVIIRASTAVSLVNRLSINYIYLQAFDNWICSTTFLNKFETFFIGRVFKNPPFKIVKSGWASSGRFTFWLTFLINPSIMPLGVLLVKVLYKLRLFDEFLIESVISVHLALWFQ